MSRGEGREEQEEQRQARWGVVGDSTGGGGPPCWVESHDQPGTCTLGYQPAMPCKATLWLKYQDNLQWYPSAEPFWRATGKLCTLLGRHPSPQPARLRAI